MNIVFFFVSSKYLTLRHFLTWTIFAYMFCKCCGGLLCLLWSVSPSDVPQWGWGAVSIRHGLWVISAGSCYPVQERTVKQTGWQADRCQLYRIQAHPDLSIAAVVQEQVAHADISHNVQVIQAMLTLKHTCHHHHTHGDAEMITQGDQSMNVRYIHRASRALVKKRGINANIRIHFQLFMYQTIISLYLKGISSMQCYPSKHTLRRHRHV